MDTDDFSNTAEAFEAFDDVPLSPARDDSIGSVIARRFSRRDMLRGSLGVAASTALFGTAALGGVVSAAQAGSGAFAFTELADGMDETHHVAEGYKADILIRWGDPLFDGVGPFDPCALTGEEQSKRLGYNNDYLAFFPARRARGAGTALRQSRIHQPRSDVSRRRRAARSQRFRHHHAGTCRGRDGRARRKHGRDRAAERQVAARGRGQAEPAHYIDDADDGRRTCRRSAASGTRAPK